MTEPFEMSATAASEAIASGKLTSEALTRSCLARIVMRDGDVKAWSYFDHDHVLRVARELDKEVPRSQLHGIPIGIKDIIDTKDMPTQYNSPLYVGRRSNVDAVVVAVLRAAGAVILGKTETHEFASGGRLPATRNPHNLDHTPGGSSSGSAAAVADRQIPLTIGTQTAGSIIRPASFCGVAAFKPTFGVLSREGATTYSPTLDTIGFFANAIADLGLLSDVLSVSRQPWASRNGIIGAKIAVCRTPWWDRATPESKAALDNAANTLNKAGATVTSLDLPMEFADCNERQHTIMRGEARASFLGHYRTNYALLHQDFRDAVEDIANIAPEKLRDALDETARLRPVFDKLATDYDAVLTPAAVGEAPLLIKRTTGDPLFNRMWSILHVPCIALPWSKGPNGLPVGIQLVAPRYRDAELLSLAAAVETLVP
jgi:Asp-tRNA(Asn)/Glu-tRNA(Gln) amidotransferase A subunit family amidase